MGCCYRSPRSKHNYSEAICEILDTVCELNSEVVSTGDLNIEWPLHNSPTRLSTNNKDVNTSSCIDHIYLSKDDLQTVPVSIV